MNSKTKNFSIKIFMAMVPALIVPIVLSGCVGGGNLSQRSTFQVNPFLWRAALEVISFAPIATTDPVGGVITTSWHTYPKQPNERFQITVYIFDRALRADALKVAIFRQTRTGRGWQTTTSSHDLARAIEDLVLTRARALRLNYDSSK